MAEKYLYPTDELNGMNNGESSTDGALPGATETNFGYQGNEAVQHADQPRRATDLYGGRKLEMSKGLKMSSGKRIDYIIVYLLPEDVSVCVCVCVCVWMWTR